MNSVIFLATLSIGTLCLINGAPSPNSDLIYFDGESSRRARPTALDINERSLQHKCDISNRLYHIDTGNCYQVGSRGPCGNNMLFYGEFNNTIYGDCDCRVTSFEAPFIYHPATGRCYQTYQQGYCTSPNEWLVFDKNSDPICEKRKCRINSDNEDSSKPNIAFRGRCVTLLDREPTLCTEDPKKQVVGFRPGETAPTCISNSYDSEEFNLAVRNIGCPSGSKRDLLGNCRKVKNVNKERVNSSNDGITTTTTTTTMATTTMATITTMKPARITRPTVAIVQGSDEDYF